VARTGGGPPATARDPSTAGSDPTEQWFTRVVVAVSIIDTLGSGGFHCSKVT
jgi:hypothetical protein